ncbi:MAG: LuxR family transcriptional regulator [Halieaceae bacterium]|nr:LuxR family transcriptional regulator [Halieaceae bacterium]MCP5164549.1 LuxR family transcriptional regulator [Pseudomonadales bacterium]MCP5204315.1 LuxR family transcriptional regulator [Pseudomonadales bacterium]
MQTLSQFSSHLARLIPAVGSDAFVDALVEMLKQLVSCDDATVILYPGTDLPQIEHFEVPPGATRSTLDVYVRGAFLLDPFYLAATRDKSFGVFRLGDLAPKDFRDSDYYKSWYRNCGYRDECGYLVPLGPEGFVNIALGKLQNRSRFSGKELELLRDIRPTIDLLCQQHWVEAGKQSSGINLRAQLHAALSAFGSSLLTEREAQVIKLVLHGHSTKTLAEKLSISVETVKLHRKHAYAKLEVSSQAELFYLFLDSVMSAGEYAGGDTLVPYLQRSVAD